MTLRNRGAASVKGRVFDWRSGAPVAGLRCEIGMRSGGGGHPSWDASNVAVSDVDGHFTLEGVAAGPIAVGCMGTNPFVTDGMAPLTLSDGQVGSVDIPILERDQQKSAGTLGAELDMTAFLAANVILVRPRGGPADRAGLRVGDVITSVDGRSVAALTPWAVQSLIVDRGAGAPVRLGIVRDGADAVVSLTLGPPVAY